MSRKIISAGPLSFPWQPQDPFLFCAYHHDRYPAGNGKLGVAPESLRGRAMGQDFGGKDGWSMYHGQEVPGFPYHPHRGFETISIVHQGVIDHSDSLGAAGRFKGGDVQWMTAGKGILHSEMFPLLDEKEGNELEMFQIWLNLPKVSKMVEPHFKMLWREDIPILALKDDEGKAVQVQVIAGHLEGHAAVAPPPNSWAANPENAVAVYHVKLSPGAKWTLPATAAGTNRSVAFYKGASLRIDTQEIPVMSALRLRPEEDITFENGDHAATLLVLEGKPIRETVVAHGPFVMNSKSEILEAFEEYRRTQFGGWPWPQQEQVHERTRSRFALHADGQEEVLEG